MNLAMQNKVVNGEAIDLSNCLREGPYYVIPLEMFQEGIDYCVLDTSEWIWSIGIRNLDGVILASTKTDLYKSDLYKCVWLR